MTYDDNNKSHKKRLHPLSLSLSVCLSACLSVCLLLRVFYLDLFNFLCTLDWYFLFDVGVVVSLWCYTDGWQMLHSREFANNVT